MYKFILLSALLTGACALDPDTSSIESQSSCEWECEPPPPPPPEGPTCTIRGEEVDLDALNVEGDRKVTFCHATGSASNPYIVITTDVNGCNGHADHLPGGNEDIFPTGGCAD